MPWSKLNIYLEFIDQESNEKTISLNTRVSIHRTLPFTQYSVTNRSLDIEFQEVSVICQTSSGYLPNMLSRVGSISSLSRRIPLERNAGSLAAQEPIDALFDCMLIKEISKTYSQLLFSCRLKRTIKKCY